MYPDLASKAEKAQSSEELKAYKYCLAGEAKHIMILQQVAKDLNSYKGGNTDFYVCPVCGNTVRSLSFSTCPVCETPKDRFEKVR